MAGSFVVMSYWMPRNDPGHAPPVHVMRPFSSRILLRWLLPLMLLSIFLAASAWYVLIVSYKGELLSEESIRRRLASECLILSSDGTPLGSIFSREHRRYVTFDEIPEKLVHAVVASEDAGFWSHGGIDFHALLRALIVNLRRGGIVQGGSTITMQTAENLYFPKRALTLGPKMKEFVWTLRLERAFPKEKILEFYLNQFYVTGTGRGAGIASEYFFNKPLSELSWLECAYITGVVHGPGLYNPFNRMGEERERTVSRIESRLSYVAGRLLECGYVGAGEADRLREEIEEFDCDTFFRKGKIYFEDLCLVDSVRRDMEEDAISAALMERGIVDYALEGVRIRTSIDAKVQTDALSALRRRVSHLKTALEGYESPPEDAHVRTEFDENSWRGQLYLGTFQNVEGRDYIFGIGDRAAVADPEGSRYLEKALDAWGRGRSVEEGARPTLAHELGEKRTALLEFRERAGGRYLFNLLRWPGGEGGRNLDGGLLLAGEKGVEAAIGGFFNRHYNRAEMAPRQWGSVFKPILFAAALELGWELDDVLPNERSLFRFQDTFYFPKPDHEPAGRDVSIMWAGVLSENLASVWLLHNLTAKLSMAEFRELAEWVGLARRKGESYREYRERIRDHVIPGEAGKGRGIVVGDRVLEEAAFDRAREGVVQDLIFEDGPRALIRRLRRLHYGRDFDNYLEEHDLTYALGRDLPERSLPSGTDERLPFDAVDGGALTGEQLAVHLMRSNFLRLVDIRDAWLDDRSGRGAGVGTASVRAYIDASGRTMITDTPESTWAVLTPDDAEEPSFDSREIADYYVDGQLSFSILERLEERMSEELRILEAMKPYSEEVLCSVGDFRVLVGLLHVNRMARLMGITTPLEPVLSFPLGPTAVTLPEIISVYRTLNTGILHENPSALIESVEDGAGEKLYSRSESPGERLLSGDTVHSLRQMLYHVVSDGTGRGAGEIGIDVEIGNAARSIHFPVMGKTGTSNNYRNSSFVGVIPCLEDGGFVRELRGRVLGVYVGYDGNESMTQPEGAFRVSGARGALPVWTAVCESVIEHGDYAGRLDRISLNIDPESSLIRPEYYEGRKVFLESVTGLPAENGDIPVMVPSRSAFRLPVR